MSEAGWPARVNAAKILGIDALGSGGVGSPGIGSYENTLRTAETLNRLGKYAVEAGVGPVYIHNHTGEFDAKYVHNGVLKSAWQILMERTDPRYVFAEVDAFWSSDAFNDVTGTQTASLINNFPTRVRMLHIKDGINVDGGDRGQQPLRLPASDRHRRGRLPADLRRRQGPRAVLPPRARRRHDDRRRHLLHEPEGHQHGGRAGPAVRPTVVPSFPSVAAGTAAAVNAVPVKITNVGDAPLTITALAVQANALDVGSQNDFAIVSHNCTGAAIAPKASCTANVGFKPTRTNYQSVARLQVTSNADNAAEAILLAAKSTGDALGGVGGDVASALSLAISPSASFGAFLPATARTYETAMAASVISTAGNATLAVADAGPNAGRLVNGAFALSSPLQIRAANAANPNPAFADLGASQSLLTYSGPTAGADTVTIGLRQAIAANEVLRAGSYSKTLTFSLTTTTP